MEDEDYVRDLIIKHKKRMDERDFLEFRPIEISRNVSIHAEGSAQVHIGKTLVAAGVKMTIGEPYPDTPNEGFVIVNAELYPFADPEYEPGPPDENAIELARVVDRGIRESEAVDLKDLVIREGEKVWGIFIDIYVLNNDGNLFDASNLAAVVALLDTRFPEYDPNTDRIIYEKKTNRKLKVNRIPISFSFAKVGNCILLDPTKAEEKAADALLTITVADKHICSVQKRGSGGFTKEEIMECVDICFENYPKILKLLKEGID